MVYAAPAKRLTLTVKGSANYDKESSILTILAGLIFVVGCSFYLTGSFLNLPDISAADAWMYNAIGAGAFILCGLVEYCNYMGGFHIFLVFAGIFALGAEILDGQQHPVSVQLNFVANHMFFCEAVKVYYAHSGDYYFMEIAKKYIMIETLQVADLCFVLGTLIDLVLSWMYLFSGSDLDSHLSVQRTDDQKIVELASASLWLICSILTLTVYIQMARAKANVGEDDDEEGTVDETTGLSTRV